jgi:hypothetical protein
MNLEYLLAITSHDMQNLESKLEDDIDLGRSDDEILEILDYLEVNLRSSVQKMRLFRARVVGFDEPVPPSSPVDFEESVLRDLAKLNTSSLPSFITRSWR